MLAMKNRNLWQMLKFTFFSISAGLIQILSYTLFYEVFGWTNYWMSHVPSLILSVLWNFTFNRRYTFRSDASISRSMLLVALYYAVFTPLSAWWGTALQNAGMLHWLVEGFNMLVNFVTEFFYQRFVVYRHRIDTNKLAQKKQQEG